MELEFQPDQRVELIDQGIVCTIVGWICDINVDDGTSGPVVYQLQWAGWLHPSLKMPAQYATVFLKTSCGQIETYLTATAESLRSVPSHEQSYARFRKDHTQGLKGG